MKKRIIFSCFSLRGSLFFTAICSLCLGIYGYAYFHGGGYYDSLEAMSWPVVGKVIAIDPGHGGFDPGALGHNGADEKDINLAIAHKLANILRQAGAGVIITRETDAPLAHTKNGDLQARLDMVRDSGADIFITIQCNSDPNSSYHGAQTFYYPGSDGGKLLAEDIQKEIKQVLNNTHRQPQKHSETYLLRNLDIPSVIVEVGFISHPEEEKSLNDSHYQNKMAWCIYSGIIDYFIDAEGKGRLRVPAPVQNQTASVGTEGEAGVSRETQPTIIELKDFIAY